MAKVKTLFLDIETAPNIVASWSLFPDSISHDAVLQEWYIICACWKWAGEKKVYAAKTYDNNDISVVSQIADAIEQADEVVAHNGKKFDCKKLQARALLNGRRPIAFPTIVDTLTQARKHFALTSNRLDAICKSLGIPAKTGTTFNLWMDALKGQKKAVDEMTAYCKNDVVILENVYNELKPFMDTGVNRALLNNSSSNCPSCGGDSITKHGTRTTRTAVYQRFLCSGCGSTFRGPERINESTKVMR